MFLGLIFYFGYKTYPKYHPCNPVLPDTIFVHDTVTHTIKDTLPWYHHVYDTTIYVDTLPFSIDTAQVIKEYYAKHFYTRYWEDSIVSVTLEDVISRNRPIDNVFSYKLLKPFQTIIYEGDVINNYNKYFMMGGTIPLNKPENFSLDLTYVWKKGYIGGGYAPIPKIYEIKGGLNLFKLK